MTHEESKARELLASIYERHQHKVSVSPSWLATEAMQTLDPGRQSHPIEYTMAHLQFRQLARTVCSGRWEKERPGEETEQHDLFPVLQKRYPKAGRSAEQEPEYVLLEHLTADDVQFNIDRLRKEAAGKMKHADALEAWAASRPQAAA